MTKIRRIVSIFRALLTIVLALLIMAMPDEGIKIVAVILSLSLTIAGIRKLIYYFSMARHMVGGRYSLYVGLLYLDLGSFTSIIIDSSRYYIILYLVGIHAFEAAVSIMRGRDAKKNGYPGWKSRIFGGIVNLIIALLCVVLIRENEAIVFLYAAGLIYSAALRIRDAFRKTAIAYIP